MTRSASRAKRLFLLRHAKSSWDDPSLTDFERPLNGRGRAAAKLMGAHMAENAHAPDLIICSSARRALETLGRILPFLAGEREIKITRSLYSADTAGDLLAEIATVGPNTGSILLIGHNPMMEDLAMLLAGSDSSGQLPILEEKYPTCGLAVLDHGRAWKSLGKGDADLSAFTVPRELAGVE